jgi:hypothetical protein
MTILFHTVSLSVTILIGAVWKKPVQKFHIFHANYYSQSRLLKSLNFCSSPSDICYTLKHVDTLSDHTIQGDYPIHILASVNVLVLLTHCQWAMYFNTV